MKVLVSDNAHIFKTPDGKFYTPSIYTNDFFQRYLDVFEEVKFIAKTKLVNKIDKDKYIEINCNGLEIIEIPWYQGLKSMFKKFFPIVKIYKSASLDCDCCIFRIAQIESYFAYFFLKNKKTPFSVEVVNDPSTFIDINKLIYFLNIKMFKYLIKKANGVSYVTNYTLQNKYPSTSIIKGENEKYFDSFYSSIELNENDIKSPKIVGLSKIFTIVHISNSISGNIKGHKTLIDAIDIVKKKGYELKVYIIGDGVDLKFYELYAEKLGMEKVFTFTGRLHEKSRIFEIFSKSDLFVYPTQVEGLPRALIEAMASGLPCLSTPIAGIPELLNPKYLIETNNHKEFANSIIRLINNPKELECMSIENINKAIEFTSNKLSKRRKLFYLKLRNFVEINNNN